MFDEHLIPDVLLGPLGGTRLFTRLSAAFAKFYIENEGLLIAAARRQVLDKLTCRIENLAVWDDVLALHRLPENMNWKVTKLAVEIDVMPYVTSAIARTKEIDQADALVTTDPEIMGGAFVFAGSRVPIAMVLASVDAGVDWDRIRASYPCVTSAHLAAARVYAEVHPRRGRPRLADSHPEWVRSSTRVVRSAQE
ncbi:hypothetical protein AwPolaro_03390 [Polaromonas sp.]|nr:hypothetical protein AwPolaro_03390 [Polaromonas sp.]